MIITVDQAFQRLNERGAIKQNPRIQSDKMIEYVGQLIGRQTPGDLQDFYRKQISRVGDFLATTAKWNPYTGWGSHGTALNMLLAAQAIPLFGDGCGSLFAMDVSTETDHPAVYFFDHEDLYERPHYAAGSSIGAFLLLLAEHDQALDEKRPQAWELTIDPDLDKCPRAPPIWRAG